MINDASTDGTLAKLHAFAARNSHVKIINKTINEGVAAARNSGLDVATGEWIGFMDPDDALVDAGYQYLVEHFLDENIDVLSFQVKDLVRVDDNEALKYDCDPSGAVEWEGNGKDFFCAFKTWVTWIFFYRASYLKQCRARFPKLCYLEDTIFNLCVFLNNARVRRVTSALYYYMIRPGAATSYQYITHKKQRAIITSIMSAIDVHEQYKATSGAKVQQRLVERQKFHAFGVAGRLLNSDYTLDEMKAISKKLQQYHILPLGDGKKDKVYTSLLCHPWLYKMVTPFYKLMFKIR